MKRIGKRTYNTVILVFGLNKLLIGKDQKKIQRLVSWLSLDRQIIWYLYAEHYSLWNKGPMGHIVGIVLINKYERVWKWFHSTNLPINFLNPWSVQALIKFSVLKSETLKRTNYFCPSCLLFPIQNCSVYSVWILEIAHSLNRVLNQGSK